MPVPLTTGELHTVSQSAVESKACDSKEEEVRSAAAATGIGAMPTPTEAIALPITMASASQQLQATPLTMQPQWPAHIPPPVTFLGAPGPYGLPVPMAVQVRVGVGARA